MGYFKDVLATSLRLIKVVVLQSMQGQKALNFMKNLNLCSEDEQRSYKFGIPCEQLIT